MQHTPFPTKEAAVKEFSKIFSQKVKLRTLKKQVCISIIF